MVKPVELCTIPSCGPQGRISRPERILEQLEADFINTVAYLQSMRVVVSSFPVLLGP